MSKYKLDEFYIPPCVLPEMERTRKRAWEEKIRVKTDNRTFYPNFYNFALVFKILGFFPVRLATFSSDLHFSWISVSTLFSVLTLPVVQIVAVNLYPADIVEQFFSYTSVLIPLCTNVIYISRLPTFIKLIQLMDSIDTNNCLKRGCEKESRKIINFCLGGVLCFLLTAILPFRLLIFGATPQAFNKYICRSHRVIVKIMETCFIYVVCYQLIVLYDRYHASLTALEERPCEEVSEQMVEELRLIHVQLVHCVRLLDHCFSLWMILVLITTSIQVINTCYTIMYGDSPASAAALAVNVFCSVFFVFYPAVLTDRIYNKSRETINFTFRMALKPYSEDILFQIYYFMRQVKVDVATVNAGGLADFNKEIITKSLSLFATFFVAAIQLTPQINILKDSFKEWLTQAT